jgi:glycosyltransferase involved in cell wall biosynthesis
VYPREYIVIPAYNEATRLPGVLKRILHLGYEHIIVVDDGSSDNTSDVARDHGVSVVRHPINLGVGAATQTGIAFALRNGARYIVTLDGDHQHLPEDIEQLLVAIRDSDKDMIIGSRFMKLENEIPPIRFFYNKVGNIVTFIVTGKYVTDSQSGMKVISRKFAKDTYINCNGFEFCVEMIRNASRHNYKIGEIPISVKYSKETMQKGQSFVNGVRMIGRLIRMNFFS